VIAARVLTLAIALAALAAAPAAAAPETSPGVSLVTSIPERGVVSAKIVGRHMYVSSLSGVSVFDIGNPRAPVRVGRLDLPNVQNEDVDVGSGILLVSDDPIGGRGVLHVVDVRDPTHPRVLSTFTTWARGLIDFFRPPRRRGIGHTATCIQQCRYAWLAGSPAGIDVIDLRDPAHPRLAGRFPAREAAGLIGTHDVQVDSTGLAWVAGSNGTAAYDVTDPVHPKLVMRTDRKGSRGPLNNFIHHNSMRLSNDVVAITEEDFGRGGCKRSGTLQTWRIAGNRLHPLDAWGVERDPSSRLLCSAHYFDARNGLIAQGFYEQGVRLIDARDPANLRQVGYYVTRPGLFWGALFAPTDPTGQTVYGFDHARGIDVLSLDRAALKPVARRGSRARGRADFGYALFVTDGGWDAVRRGQRLRIQFAVDGRPARVGARVTVPPQLVDVRPGRGVRFDRATRTLRFKARPGTIRSVRARVARSAPLGTQLELIGYVAGPHDPLPLDDRGVDEAVVARRAVRDAPRARSSAARTWQAYCALPLDYTF
jgi:LVIVD repeat-containing protein